MYKRTPARCVGNFGTLMCILYFGSIRMGRNNIIMSLNEKCHNIFKKKLLFECSQIIFILNIIYTYYPYYIYSIK